MRKYIYRGEPETQLTRVTASVNKARVVVFIVSSFKERSNHWPAERGSASIALLEAVLI